MPSIFHSPFFKKKKHFEKQNESKIKRRVQEVQKQLDKKDPSKQRKVDKLSDIQ